MFCFADSFRSDAAVFWSRQKCAHVLPVTATDQSIPWVDEPFDFSALLCRKTILECGGGDQHILMQDDVGQLQLVNDGMDFPKAYRVQVDAVWPMHQLRHRLRALECLNALKADGRFPVRLFLPDNRGRRLCYVLRALDGSLAGLSHREIAMALHGEERVDADWTDPGNHLRDQVRRAVRRGRVLMHGGYRAFLS